MNTNTESTQPTIPDQLQGTAQPMPLLYRHLVAVNNVTHAALCINETPDYRVAAQVDALPLLASELGQALRHYPLAFLDTGPDSAPLLVAITGLANGHNLFVDAQGRWLSGAYVPAYVRRYPWFAVQVHTQGDLLLAMDDTATQLNQEQGTSLFDEQGQPSALLQQVMAFEREYRFWGLRTQAMVLALQQAQVLEPGQFTLTAHGGESRQLNGLLVVSETRLQQLTPETLLTLHSADALGLAYAQLMSMGNFVHLPVAVETVAPTVANPPRKSRLSKSNHKQSAS
jgi:hypothetical protein